MEIDYSEFSSEILKDFDCLNTFSSGVETMDLFIQNSFDS